MLRTERFVNELMSSNCYVLWDDETHKCVIIDPGSEKSLREIDFIESNELSLDYVILTHEHSDHTWGVNALANKYADAKIVCSKDCTAQLPKVGDMYFRFYYDNPTYHYEVEKVDIVVEDESKLAWDNYYIFFSSTPGHCIGSICFSIDKYLFTGDTIMDFKQHISRDTGNKKILEQSIDKINSLYKDTNAVLCPGHGSIRMFN